MEKIDVKGKRVLVTGGLGFLGRHVVTRLTSKGAFVSAPSSRDFDLRDPRQAEAMFREIRPEFVVHLAARVGGISANQAHPATFYYDNLLMGTYAMEFSRRAGVQKFLGISSVCAYPKLAPVPTPETSLWDGYPEETNAGYGFGKKMLVVQSQAYRAEFGFPASTLLVANLYGPGDNMDPSESHVIAALIRRFLEAVESSTPEVTVWGDGTATRDFLYVEDAADGVVAALERYDSSLPLNLGSGKETSIRFLAETIARVCGFGGIINWDASKPAGQPRRLFDIARARAMIGFEPSTNFEAGLANTVEWYRSQREISVR